MEKYDEDKELRQLIKGIKLDKPAPGFSTLVMDRVFQEKALMEQVKSEPILSKSFWIIIALFAILMITMVLLSWGIPAGEYESLLPDLSSSKLSSGYQSFFTNLGNLPASIAGISCGISFLVFLERYLNSKRPEMV